MRVQTTVADVAPPNRSPDADAAKASALSALLHFRGRSTPTLGTSDRECGEDNS
jgi:hypothetical protein